MLKLGFSLPKNVLCAIRLALYLIKLVAFTSTRHNLSCAQNKAHKPVASTTTTCCNLHTWVDTPVVQLLTGTRLRYDSKQWHGLWCCNSNLCRLQQPGWLFWAAYRILQEVSRFQWHYASIRQSVLCCLRRSKQIRCRHGGLVSAKILWHCCHRLFVVPLPAMVWHKCYCLLLHQGTDSLSFSHLEGWPAPISDLLTVQIGA